MQHAGIVGRLRVLQPTAVAEWFTGRGVLCGVPTDCQWTIHRGSAVQHSHCMKESWAHAVIWMQACLALFRSFKQTFAGFKGSSFEYT